MENQPPDVYEGLIVDGRYLVKGFLGAGATSIVRLAHDNKLNREVALKFLKPEFVDHADIRQRFLTEARLAASLNNPHIVSVYDTGEINKVPYLTMELLNSQSLATVLAQRNLSPQETEQLAYDVLDALKSVHASGVLHRDIKPANIMKAPHGWKLVDFGIAKSATSPDQTVIGTVIGTPSYLAPERRLGQKATVSTDLYALAVIMYEALSGLKPFDPSAPLDSSSITPLDMINPQVPINLSTVVMKGLASSPNLRFHSTTEMENALKYPDNPTVVSPVIPPPQYPKPKRSSLWPPFILLLLLVAIVIALFTLLSNSDSSVNTTTTTTMATASSTTSTTILTPTTVSTTTPPTTTAPSTLPPATTIPPTTSPPTTAAPSTTTTPPSTTTTSTTTSTVPPTTAASSTSTTV